MAVGIFDIFNLASGVNYNGTACLSSEVSGGGFDKKVSNRVYSQTKQFDAGAAVSGKGQKIWRVQKIHFGRTVEWSS